MKHYIQLLAVGLLLCLSAALTAAIYVTAIAFPLMDWPTWTACIIYPLSIGHIVISVLTVRNYKKVIELTDIESWEH